MERHTSVGNVSNTRLQRQQVLGKSPSVDLRTEEVNDVVGDGSGGRILGSVDSGVVGPVGFNNSHDSFGIDRDGRASDSI